MLHINNKTINTIIYNTLTNSFRQKKIAEIIFNNIVISELIKPKTLNN
jgi:hypothetical protein